MLLKIGELAKRTGLTVRALHHYDAIGLVKPSARSDAGYRLYDRADIARLYRIQALRGLGLGLTEVGAILDGEGEGANLRHVIQQQLTSLEQQLKQAAVLRDRLHLLDAQLARAAEPDLEEWLTTLGLMATHRQYFTQEEIDALERHKQSEQNAQWPGLVEEVRALMERGVAVDSREAKDMARRWLVLSKETMGEDPRFFLKLMTMHRNEFSVQALTGVDGPVLDFILLGVREIRCELYARYLKPEEVQYYRTNFVKNMTEWHQLFAEVRYMLEQGVPAEQPQAQALMRKWSLLFIDSWGTDLTTRERVLEAHHHEPFLLMGCGIDNPALQDYISRAMAQLVADAAAAADSPTA